MFAPDELIAALADGEVEYVLIGGLAVGAHGFPRATKDVDIVPAPHDANLQRLAGVLSEIEARNFGTGDFDPTEFPFDPLKPEDLRKGGNFVLSTRLGRLDVMQWVPGVPGELAFEHLTRGAVETSLGGRSVRVCSREDLVAMKRAAVAHRISLTSSSSAPPEAARPLERRGSAKKHLGVIDAALNAHARELSAAGRSQVLGGIRGGTSVWGAGQLILGPSRAGP